MTVWIVAEELSCPKRDNDRMTQNGKICNSPMITTVNSMAYTAAIRTDSIRKAALCVNMIGAHIFKLHLFNKQVIGRIKGRQVGFH